MTREEIYKIWLDAKAGQVNEHDLVQRRTEGYWPDTIFYYDCPCGGKDHHAARYVSADPNDRTISAAKLSCVLNCYVTDKQWLIRPVDTAATIKGEEEKYIALLAKAPAIVKKVVAKRGWSEDTKAFLLDTHGIEGEVAEEIVSGRWKS